MKLNLYTITTIVLLLGWIGLALRILFSYKYFLSWKTALNIVTSGCIIICAVGYFGLALSSWGGLNWLPKGFEWPIGTASNVLIAADGTHIVPHTYSSRIQIYNADLEFQRGWFVDASGGIFTLVPAENETFYVLTARGHKKIWYDIEGNVLTSETYNYSEYSRIAAPGSTIKIPTSMLLRIFSKPFIPCLFGAAGILFTMLGKALGTHSLGSGRIFKFFINKSIFVVVS